MKNLKGRERKEARSTPAGKYLKQTGTPEAILGFKLHDFGFRGVSPPGQTLLRLPFLSRCDRPRVAVAESVV